MQFQELPENIFPDFIRFSLKNILRRSRQRMPVSPLYLTFKLSRTPSGVAGEDSKMKCRLRIVCRIHHFVEHVRTGSHIDTGCNRRVLLIVFLGVVQNQQCLGFDRPS